MTGSVTYTGSATVTRDQTRTLFFLQIFSGQEKD